MARKPSGGKRPINKSAITGRIVSEHYAKTHPKTTVKMMVPKGGKKR